MRFRKEILEHLAITWEGFRRWFFAQLQDSLAVGFLWLAGLWILGIPLAPLWALLGALLQFVPVLGTILALIGPAVAAMVASDWIHLVYVFLLYAGIVILDGFLLQPLLMKRSARVPFWASILLPVMLGLFLSVWGILLAPPLLAIIYTYRNRRKGIPQPRIPGGKDR